MIEVRNICLKRGNFSLDDISFSVSPATCHVIAGPSGCGKTVLLETIIGIHKPERGTIVANGRDITKRNPEERGISYVPQDLAIFPHLTVRENVFYSQIISRKTNSDLGNRIVELATRIGIAPLFNRYPTSLSGGEKQRVALLRALASGNSVLLLDEPFSALHEGFKTEIWQLIQILCKEFNSTTILVTHDLREIAFLADTLSVMLHGKVLASGKPSDVFARPKTTSLAHFAGLRNLWPAKVDALPDGRLSLFVPAIGLKTFSDALSVSNSAKNVHFGIWPSAVIPILADEHFSDEDSLLSAIIVREYGLFNQRTIVCRTASGGLVELNISCSEKNKSALQVGSNIRLFLPGDSFFLLEEDDHTNGQFSF